MAPLIDDQVVTALMDAENRESLNEFIYGREIIDLLIQYPGCIESPDQFLGVLKKLAPRLYSIASSPKMHPNEVHLTVGAVRYTAHGRQRAGVCSTFLADRVGDQEVPVFTHHNPNFALPDDPNVAIIMVGPGTGIAPFRAFLEERIITGASGKNWMFFGDQHVTTDFLYRDELQKWKTDGSLSISSTRPFHGTRNARSTCSIA